MDFVWGLEAEAFSGAVGEDGGEAVALRLGDPGEVRAFGQILPEQADGVFAAANAFLRVMRRGEVEVNQGSDELNGCSLHSGV